MGVAGIADAVVGMADIAVGVAGIAAAAAVAVVDVAGIGDQLLLQCWW